MLKEKIVSFFIFIVISICTLAPAALAGPPPTCSCDSGKQCDCVTLYNQTSGSVVTIDDFSWYGISPDKVIQPNKEPVYPSNSRIGIVQGLIPKPAEGHNFIATHIKVTRCLQSTCQKCEATLFYNYEKDGTYNCDPHPYTDNPAICIVKGDRSPSPPGICQMHLTFQSIQK